MGKKKRKAKTFHLSQFVGLIDATVIGHVVLFFIWLGVVGVAAAVAFGIPWHTNVRVTLKLLPAAMGLAYFLLYLPLLYNTNMFGIVVVTSLLFLTFMGSLSGGGAAAGGLGPSAPPRAFVLPATAAALLALGGMLWWNLTRGVPYEHQSWTRFYVGWSLHTDLEGVYEASPLNWMLHLTACLLFAYLLLVLPLVMGTDLGTILNGWVAELKNGPAPLPR